MKFVKGVMGGAVAMILNLSPVVQALLLLVAMDLISGWAKAFITKTINSDASLRGMTKKGLMLLMVAAAWVAEHKLGAPLDLDLAVAGFYCVTEGISIIENAKACGLGIPPILVERFNKIQEEKK